jgi:TetR/AcrR family transcriptional regulator, transcriptional repressor of aconitase
MPRITEERRAARREQVLEAARACVQEHGLEAVSMEMIITRSGLSTGAVYSYFKGKESIISAAVTEGTAELADVLQPIFRASEPLPLPELVERVLNAIVEFGPHTSDIDRLVVAIHGWSHSQSDPDLRRTSRAAHIRLREAYAQAARRLQEAGGLPPSRDPADVAQLLTSITLGFVAQRALVGSADVRAHVAALNAL